MYGIIFVIQRHLLGQKINFKVKQAKKWFLTWTVGSKPTPERMNGTYVNWCPKIRAWWDLPAALIVHPKLGRRHQHVTQCYANIQLSLVYKELVLVISGFLEMLITNVFANLKILNKLKSWSAGYTAPYKTNHNWCHPSESLLLKCLCQEHCDNT